jgi:hypothetical protein
VVERSRLWRSKDVAFIVFFSVLTFINFSTLVQFLVAAIPIPGIIYCIDIGGAIIFGVSFLMYEGRRWRVLAQGLLILAFGFYSSYGGNAAFYLITLFPWVLRLLIADVVFNSLYGRFKERGKLLWLSIMAVTFFFGVGPFLAVLFFWLFPVYFPASVLTPILITITLALPVIIALSLTGGYLGFKIYKRVEKLS